MTAALTPDLALAYVQELSADVRAGIVVDGAGEHVAGSPELAAAAREYLEAGGATQRTERGVVIAARGPVHAIVVACGPHVLTGPTALDVAAALEALDGEVLDDPRSTVTPQLTDAVLCAL